MVDTLDTTELKQAELAICQLIQKEQLGDIYDDVAGGEDFPEKHTVPVTEVCYSAFSHKPLCKLIFCRSVPVCQQRLDGVTSTYREYYICIIYGATVVLVLSLLTSWQHL